MFWGKTAQQLTDIERALLVQEVQHLKMQEDETVDAETVAPEQESGWMRFVAGFKEGWNEHRITSVDTKGKTYLNSPVMSPLDPRIISAPHDPNVIFSSFNPFNENFLTLGTIYMNISMVTIDCKDIIHHLSLK
jgi:hypothetical protein